VKKRKPRKPARRKAEKRSEQVHPKKNDFLTQLVDVPVTQAVEKALGYAVDTTVEVVVNLLPDGV
jgi:hypothetical protein